MILQTSKGKVVVTLSPHEGFCILNALFAAANLGPVSTDFKEGLKLALGQTQKLYPQGPEPEPPVNRETAAWNTLDEALGDLALDGDTALDSLATYISDSYYSEDADAETAVKVCTALAMAYRALNRVTEVGGEACLVK